MIKLVKLNGVEITREKAKEYCRKYITTQMVMECFLGGIVIDTPIGELVAEVTFNYY